MLALASGLERLDKSDTRIHRTVDTSRPFLGGVFQTEFDGVDPQLLGDLIDDDLAGEGRLSRPGRAIRLGLWLIHANVVAVHSRVRQVITTENAHAPRTDHPARESASVVGQPRLASDQSPHSL